MQDKISGVIYSDNSQTCDLIQAYLADYSADCSIVHSTDFDWVVNTLRNIEKPILILDSSNEFSQDLLLKFSTEVPNCRILVLISEPSVDLIVKSLRLGAKEVLPLPIIKSEFFDALDRLIAYQKPIKNSNCKIYSVFSNKGGIGKTSIATNLAIELANVTKEKVALIDLNFQLGDVTTFMDLKPSFNISYILQNLDKINEEFLLSTLERYNNSSLYVLADPPYLKQADEISPKQISKLLDILKKTFSYIIIDAESSFDAKNIAALTESNSIFLVTVANLPALRNSQRCLDLFSKLGFNDVSLVLNRYMENDDITIKDVEKVVNKKVFWKIPNNYFTMMSSINKGIPVSDLNPDSNVAKNYRDLALLLTERVYKEHLANKYSNILGGQIGLK